MYVDGFVIPVPKDKIENYFEAAKKAGAVWKDHGALEYRECVGEDLDVHCGCSFPQGIGAKPDETIVFAWIGYKSREDRDRINAAVMEDPRINEMMTPDSHPFDINRMIFGGFEVRVDA